MKKERAAQQAMHGLLQRRATPGSLGRVQQRCACAYSAPRRAWRRRRVERQPRRAELQSGKHHIEVCIEQVLGRPGGEGTSDARDDDSDAGLHVDL